MRTFAFISLALLLLSTSSCKKDDAKLLNQFNSETLSARRSGGINVDITNGLVAYYPFNGNAIDESGNGNDGTVYGATLTLDRKGRKSRAYSFNGIDNYIQTTVNSISSTSYSISCFFRTDVIQNNEIGLICSRGGFNNITGISFIDASYIANFISYCDNSSNYGYTTGPLNDGKWHHFVSTYDSGIVKMYFDGLLVYEGGTVQTICMQTNFKFGNDDIVPGRYFNGKLDEIRFYKIALTQEQVTFLSKQ